MRRPEGSAPTRTRRGNALTNAGIIVAGLAFSAIVIDLGWNWAHVSRVQYLNDAVATAGASRLDGTLEGIDRAEQAALKAMRNNDYFGSVAYGSLFTGVDNLTFGIHTRPERGQAPLPIEQSFKPVTNLNAASDETIAQINAVRVSSRDDAIQPFLSGAIFNQHVLRAASQSTAVSNISGASKVGCYLPITVPDCYFTDDQRETFGQQTFYIRDDNNANTGNLRMGWGMANGQGASYLSNQIRGQCQGGLASLGDPVQLDNGVKQSVFQTLQQALNSSDTTWAPEMGPKPPSTFPKTLEGPIFVFNGGPGFCGADAGTRPWTGSYPISGIAWGVVYDMKLTGASHERYAAIRLDFARWHDMAKEGGGPNYGVIHRGVSQLVE
ncbi:MAG: hypothetical protein EA397_15870 [Deltaproteobacteria bacterium]|nr:MAG: hypothetical protein EA397_15870 [Deltaproteobacteria bacterium]